MFDLVIRNGVVIDGTGLAPYRSDVGIRNGVIVQIGRIREAARSVLDAEGHVVTPGFIDGHTHMDAQVFWDALGSCACWHGVTTAVMGHCGFSLAPASREESHFVVRNLERAEDISGAALAAGIDWTWTSFGEYLDAVDAVPKGINYAANIGHSALRTFVMGERAFEEAATPDDLQDMRRVLREALEVGAYGFTTSRTKHHETSDGRPVASRLATWEEVRDLVEVMSDVGAGVFQFAEDAPGPDERSARDSQIVDLAASSGVPVAIAATGSLIQRALGLLDEGAEAGANIFGLTHCRGIGLMSSFLTQLPFDSLAEWQQVRSLPPEELRAALSDPDVRQRLVWSAHHGEYGRTIGAQAPKPDFERLQVLDQPLPPHPTVGEVARARGVDPVEAMIDLALETDLRQFFVQTSSPFDAESVKRAMKHPRTVMTFSDAGAHVSQISDCSIQTHLLGHWVRERQDFTLEEAVRMITLAPARAWGFHDRGLLREGLVADINVFDPEQVGPDLPTVVPDLPAGGKRIKQTASGFLATIVGGEIVHDRGEHTGALPGRVLRGPLACRDRG